MRYSPASLIVAGTCLVLGGSMALSQDAPAQADQEPLELAMPQLLPGYYSQTITVQRMDMSLPGTKMGDLADPALLRTYPPVTERVCNTGDELSRASEFLPGGSGLGEGCRLVSSRLDGTRGSGDLRCASPEGQMTIHYEGDFTETSRRAIISMQGRPTKLVGRMSFKLSVAMERLTESCTDDIPADAASAAADVVREADSDVLKKM